MGDLNKELADSADILLSELLRLRAGENLLIYADQDGDQRVPRTIQVQAEKRGGRAEIILVDSTIPLEDQAQPVARRIQQGSFDAICELSEQYFYLTPVWRVARDKAARLYSVAGMDADAFIRCVGNVNHERMHAYGVTLKKMLQASRRLRILTESGTDIRMRLGLGRRHRTVARLRNQLRKVARTFKCPERVDRLVPFIRRRPQAHIFSPCGILDRETQTTFIGGQLAFRGIPATIEGTAVIDACLWPPPEIGMLDQPLILRIEHGSVVDIGGCPVKFKILANRFEGQTPNIEHFCIGFNPGAQISGKILEAERAFGALTVGFGQGVLHTDGVIRSPSLLADETSIEENGCFVHQELALLEEDLVRSELGVRHAT